MTTEAGSGSGALDAGRSTPPLQRRRSDDPDLRGIRSLTATFELRRANAPIETE